MVLVFSPFGFGFVDSPNYALGTDLLMLYSSAFILLELQGARGLWFLTPEYSSTFFRGSFSHSPCVYKASDYRKVTF